MLMRLDEKDNVAVVLTDARAGEKMQCGELTITLLDDIPFGHKCALTDIARGGKIVKYGFPIGYATEEIRTGNLVREYNMKGLRGRGDLAD